MQKLIKNDKILLYKVIEKNIKHSYIKPQDGYVLITKSKHMPLERITNRLLDKFDYYLESTKKIKEDILYVWNKPCLLYTSLVVWILKCLFMVGCVHHIVVDVH